MIIRIYYKILGAHVHCRVYSGYGEALGKSGDLVFRLGEWEDVVDLWKKTVKFIPESEMAL